jgi:hypothetical protein
MRDFVRLDTPVKLTTRPSEYERGFADGRRDALVLDEGAIERAARALCASQGGNDWDDMSAVACDGLRNDVRAVVAALRNDKEEDGRAT